MRKSTTNSTIYSYFTKESDIHKEADDVVNASFPSANDDTSPSEIPPKKLQKIASEGIDISSLERDPGIRQQIWEYPVNQQDEIRRAYIILKAYQPKLSEYPKSGEGKQKRRLQSSWFTLFPWLEYSPINDKAFCFPCFLFNKPSGNPKQNAFTVDGFCNWKKVKNGKDCSFLMHFGKDNCLSPHKMAQKAHDDLKDQRQHIAKAMEKFTFEQIASNRLRINASIQVVRLLAIQRCSFRSRDESSSSLNRGNFLEFLDVLVSNNEKLLIAVDKTPKNETYTSPQIQKESSLAVDKAPNVKSFCQVRNIGIPDMSARYIDRRGKTRNQLDNFTIEHHYRVDIFYAAIDLQLQEISGRFSEKAMELLILSSALNPRNSSECFRISDICLLVDKFYSEDFTRDEKMQLKMQLQHYEYNVVEHSDYKNLSSISELCPWLVKNGKSLTYNLVFRVIVFLLTLPVSTATTERSFSAMNIVKSSLRNKMEDEFLTDALMIFIEREIAKRISLETLIEDFRDLKERKVLFG